MAVFHLKHDMTSIMSVIGLQCHRWFSDHSHSHRGSVDSRDGGDVPLHDFIHLFSEATDFR
jgi:hypothetical protein